MEELYERFPEMKPINSLPSLSTVNGFGMTMYGSRDHDPETGTYVKTQWFALLFVPILPLKAFRVADAPGGGWYFLGQVPLSSRAKVWPFAFLLLVGAIVGGAFWYNHTQSPEYAAKKKLDEAARLTQAGKVGEAGKRYREVVEGNTAHAPTAMKEMNALLELPDLGDKEGVGELFGCAWAIHDKENGAKNLAKRGLAFAKEKVEKCPGECLAVLEAVDPAVFEMPPEERNKTETESLGVRQKILEAMLKEKPNDLDLTVKLAVVFERSGRRDRSEALLKPHEKKLSDTEGARVLGQIYADQGKFEEAYTLLEPYTEVRLKRMLEAEREMSRAYEAFQNDLFAKLDKKKAPDFDYKRYSTLGPQQQNEMIRDYLLKRMNQDPALRRIREAAYREVAVVPVALDLGIVMMRRAQGMADQDRRKAQLERAEKTFLSLQNAAAMTGAAGNLKLRLGEVNYWMGKQQEGKKLFDELLKEEGRKFDVLLVVAKTLRDLGDDTAARTLSEEAYNAGGTEEKRKQAAIQRALLFKDLEDEISWLNKSDTTAPGVKAMLLAAKGYKAQQDGKDEESVPHFREASKLYEEMPESTATLNNNALVLLSLYSVTGDPDPLNQAVRKMEKASSLNARDSILVSNTASTSLGAALREMLGEKMDLKKLKRQGSFDLFSYLHSDEAGRQAFLKQVKESAAVAKSRSYYDRARILGPKSARVAGQLLEVLDFLDDVAGMKALSEQIDKVPLDLEQNQQELKDFYAGKRDDKTSKDLAASLLRLEKAVKETRDVGGVTFAVAAVGYIRAQLGLETLGKPFDVEAMVQLAEEAYKTTPSSATMATLESALIARASRMLTEKVPEYAAMVKKARRSLTSVDFIAIALWREGPARQAALANEDVKRVIELVRESVKRYPDSPDEWLWAMLLASHPDEAKAMAEKVLKSERAKAERDLRDKLSPLSASRALRRCWVLEMEGKTDQAKDVLKRMAAAGVPMPFDVK